MSDTFIQWLTPARYRYATGPVNTPYYPAYNPHVQQEQAFNMNNWNYAPPPPMYTGEAPPKYDTPPGAPPGKSSQVKGGPDINITGTGESAGIQAPPRVHAEQ